MDNPAWMFVATYPEWLNWIAVGRIRCNSRISLVRGSEDVNGFALLMDRAPDVSINDDQAFILAKLKPNFRIFQQDVISANSQELSWLLIEAVDEFIPLSDRGARLIEADAKRAKAKISPASFQNAWQSWSSIQKEIRADCCGRTLVKVMGLGEPNLSLIPSQIYDYLSGNISLPNAEKASELRATNAFAWAASFAIFGLLVGEEEKKSQNNELGLGEVIRNLRQDFLVKESILKDKLLRDIAGKLSEIIKSNAGVEISILQLVVVFHYADVIASGKDVVLHSLVKDIGEVVIECGQVVGANTAYIIGRAMDDIAVTTLAYASSPLLFSALIPGQLPCSIDVKHHVDIRQKELAKKDADILEAQSQADAAVASYDVLEVQSTKNSLFDVDSSAKHNFDHLLNTHLDEGNLDLQFEGQQNLRNATLPLMTFELKDVVKHETNLDIDIEPLIPSEVTEDEAGSQDSVIEPLILNSDVQDLQTKSQRTAKNTGNKKKKDKL